MSALHMGLILARLLLFIALTCATQAHAQVPLSLTRGWNLLGNSSNAPIPVSPTFSDPSQVATVWKWNRTGNTWAFYAPSMSSAELTAYAQGKGYDVLGSIDPKEGFWVDAKTAWTAFVSAGTPVTLAASDLQAGANLVASSDGMTPSELNQSLDSSLNPAGKAIVTAWAWDTAEKEWRFYSAALESQGGTALADYITSKGYLGFTSPLSAAEGFWLNVGTAPQTVPGAPTGVTATTDNAQVSVSFSAPASNGGAAITSYTVISIPGGITATGATSPIIVAGLAILTPYTFTVTATNSVGTGSASAASKNVTLIPPSVPAACSAPVGPPALSMVASRNSGVAPLAVFFDATGTTSAAVTTQPFHEIEYRWNFDDPTAGTWNYGAVAGLSRNSATGPVAAHVFETPGTYTVAMDAFDGTNTASCSVQITVFDPEVVFAGDSTVCVAATSDPAPGTGGCPPGAAHYRQADWPTIVNTYATTGSRVLLKRGDTFTGTATASLSTIGPGIIGAFGIGAKPVIRTTATSNYSTILMLAGSASDWRLMDLDIDGQSDIHREAIASAGNASLSRILMLRLHAHDLGGAIEIAIAGSTPAVPDELALVDSTIQRLTGGGATSTTHGILAWASRLVILGNLFDDSKTVGNAEHMIRIAYANKGVISNNRIQLVHDTKEMLALRAPCYTTPCGSNNYFPSVLSGASAATRQVLISDNSISVNTYVGVKVGPVTTTDPAIIEDVILERNHYPMVAGAGGGSRVLGSKITIRNEIVDFSGATVLSNGIRVDGPTAAMATSDNVWIYNNSIYDSAARAFSAISLASGAGSSNITVRNNVAYAPAGTGTPIMISNSGAIGLTADHNSSNSQVKNTLPFAVTSPVSPGDFAAANYAIGGGTGAPVWSDFFRRTVPSPRDMGSVAH